MQIKVKITAFLNLNEAFRQREKSVSFNFKTKNRLIP